MSGPLILDTGGWLLALAGEAEYASALEEASLLYVPGLVLAEVDYHLRRRRAEMRRLMADLLQGAYLLEPTTADDLARADEIDRKFASLELGLVDATVAAVAERLAVRRVLTTDSDFVAVRIGRQWDQALDLVVPPPRRPRRRG
ncbi:MAG TPA: PIN domain-containing protein [Myxococcales bacterium]|nr:PIN domain-containing protein [Myxococcales bacterium]